MSHAITVSDKLKLPPDVVTTATAVLGIRGSGKTNTGVVIVEDLLEAGHQVIVVDPLDVWWGLKSSADGKAAGYPITVLGGVHADVPLAEGDGRVLADFLVDHPVPAILSLRHLSKSAGRRFLLAFADHLYHRKGEQGKGTPVLMVVDEASMFIPQHVTGDVAQLVGAIQSWVRQGRVAGIGCMLIDQRPATVNKDVLSQVELLVAHRLVAPQDRKALREWIDAHATAEQQKEFDATIATQSQGQAWFWSPEWLQLFKNVQVRRRRTFDSSATPKAGQAIAAPKKAAEVDLAGLRAKLASTIEKARAEDPKELKKRIAALEKQLATPVTTSGPAVVVAPKIVEKPVISDQQIERLEKLQEKVAARVEAWWKRASGEINPLLDLLNGQATEIAKVRMQAAEVRNSCNFIPNPITRSARPAFSAGKPTSNIAEKITAPRRSPTAQASGEAIPKGELSILTAVAQTDGGCSREQLTVLTGYKRSTRDAYIQRARERGYVDDQGGQIVATQAGIDALGSDFQPLPTGDALREHWLARLPKGERDCLVPLIDQYPNAVDRNWLTDFTGFKRSTRDAYLQRLGTRKLIEATRDGVRASSILFDWGGR